MAKEETEVKTSLPPNPVIANVMYLAGYIENWGRGLSMMNDECLRVGLPNPKIIESGNIVKLVFARPNDIANTSKRISKETSRGQVEDKYEDELNSITPKFFKLIKAVGEEWLSAIEIRLAMGFKSRGPFVKNYLSPAIQMGILRLENPDSPNAPNQRYGLTIKGKSIYYTHKD